MMLAENTKAGLAAKGVGTKVTKASVHVFFIIAALFVSRYHPERDLSALVAVEYGLQALGFAQLVIHVLETQSMRGISVKMLLAVVVSRFLRLCSTMWLQGYLPAGDTGVWVCQFTDWVSLSCAAGLVVGSYRSDSLRRSVEPGLDRAPLVLLLVVCGVLGALFHGDLDNYPLFDGLFCAGVYASCGVLLPQLAVEVGASTRDHADAVSLHFSVPFALSSAPSIYFWYLGYSELQPLIAGQVIFAAILAQAGLIACLLACATAPGQHVAGALARKLGWTAPPAKAGAAVPSWSPHCHAELGEALPVAGEV